MRKFNALKLAVPLAVIAQFGGATACAGAGIAPPSRLESCQPGLFTSIKINEQPAQGGVYAVNTGACGAITNPVGAKRVGEVAPGQLFILICREDKEAATVIVNYRGILGGVALTRELAAMDLTGPAGPVPTC